MKHQVSHHNADTPRHFSLTLAAGFVLAFLPSAYAADPEVSTSAQAAAGFTKATYLRDAILQNAALRDAAQTRSYRAWKFSLAPVIATQVLDAASSHGLREVNPVLASSDGSFGAKATLLKFGIAGALLGVEYIVVRKHPSAAKVLWKLNVVSAAITGATAAHNYSLHSSQH